MNQEEGCVSIGGPFSKTASRSPRHHQYEDILRYVQKVPGDISWTIDRAENVLLALMEFLVVSANVPGDWAPVSVQC